tara:strand:- start:274 stop:813 length:540 start_codon:yes stop_codon:yes gene_type:complete
MTQTNPFREQFLAMLDDPSRERYLACLAMLAEQESYDPYSDELARARRLLDEGAFEAADTLLMKAIGNGNLLLSASAHMLLGYAAHKVGDTKRSTAERWIARRCFDALLLTGDGTRQSPYVVARISDEYDVLHLLGKQLDRQSLHEDADGRFDAMNCTDGETIWFDITLPKGYLDRLYA